MQDQTSLRSPDASDESAPQATHRKFATGRLLWIILVSLLGLAALVCWWLARPSPARSISVAFIGYTNAPNTSLRFALFCVTNQDRVAIRWRGIMTEIEGDADLKAPIINGSLPWIAALRPNPPAPLKPGGNFVFAVGQPVDGSRWRVQVWFSRVTIRDRLFELRFARRVPKVVARFLPGSPAAKTANSEWVPPP